MAFLGKIDVVSTGLSVASTAATLMSLPVLGLAISVVRVVYNLITGRRKAAKARRRARRLAAYLLALNYNNIGTELIRQVYGMGIPDWTTDLYGNYYQFGKIFHQWSSDPGNELKRKELISYLKTWGIEPSRFMGGENVRDSEMLNYEEEYVCGPEKYLTGKESLIYLGYTEEDLSNLPYQFFIRVFDIINSMRLAITEEQASLIKLDFERHLRSGGLDPSVVFKTIEPLLEAERKVQEWQKISETVTYPQIIQELEKKGLETGVSPSNADIITDTSPVPVQKASLPIFLIAGLILGLFALKKGV
ncbi:MAG: hypothetical protein K6T87_15950 [Roseiflexus sp.]|uniref:hypothetical protein n=1 Tax=Roseiflexus sp. TaxID=2562120 RepID=UPI0025EA5F89|nr:hypothetical protein [Roseiflexus sp.]MCL6542049.1 hypothetical protein [Roseiflexus sp.]